MWVLLIAPLCTFSHGLLGLNFQGLWTYYMLTGLSCFPWPPKSCAFHAFKPTIWIMSHISAAILGQSLSPTPQTTALSPSVWWFWRETFFLGGGSYLQGAENPFRLDFLPLNEFESSWDKTCKASDFALWIPFNILQFSFQWCWCLTITVIFSEVDWMCSCLEISSAKQISSLSLNSASHRFSKHRQNENTFLAKILHRWPLGLSRTWSSWWLLNF